MRPAIWEHGGVGRDCWAIYIHTTTVRAVVTHGVSRKAWSDKGFVPCLFRKVQLLLICSGQTSKSVRSGGHVRLIGRVDASREDVSGIEGSLATDGPAFFS